MASVDAVTRPQRSLELEVEAIGVLKAIQQHGVTVGNHKVMCVTTLARVLGRPKQDLLDRRQLLARALVNLAEHGYLTFLQYPIRIHDGRITASASVPWPAIVVLRRPAEFPMHTGTLPMPGTTIGTQHGVLGKLPLTSQLVNATISRACGRGAEPVCVLGFTPKPSRFSTDVHVDAFATDDGPSAAVLAHAVAESYAEGLGPNATRVRSAADATVDEDLAVEVVTHPLSSYTPTTPARKVGGSFDPRSIENEDAPYGSRVLSRQPLDRDDAQPSEASAVVVRIRPDVVVERMLDHGDAIRYGGI